MTDDNTEVSPEVFHKYYDWSPSVDKKEVGDNILNHIEYIVEQSGFIGDTLIVFRVSLPVLTVDNQLTNDDHFWIGTSDLFQTDDETCDEVEELMQYTHQLKDSWPDHPTNPFVCGDGNNYYISIIFHTDTNEMTLPYGDFFIRLGEGDGKDELFKLLLEEAWRIWELTELTNMKLTVS